MKAHSKFLLFLIIILLTACSTSRDQDADRESSSEKVTILATTNIVGDVVQNISGDQYDVRVLLPPGVDPHGYIPTPKDMTLISDGDVIFVNGAGLEEFIDPLIESAGAAEKVIDVSEGISLIESADEHVEESDHHGADPHTWTDPNNVVIWVKNIEQALVGLYPGDQEVFSANTENYIEQLEEMDRWIRDKVQQVDESDRMLVTDHETFAYFAQAYGFTQIGTLIPGYSTMSELSAQELVQIQDSIKKHAVKAIFVGNTVNPNLAESVSKDTGTQLVFLYTGSLSEEDGDAGSYLDYMRYNVNAIVNALR